MMSLVTTGVATLPLTNSLLPARVLHRKCACGSNASSGTRCAECEKKDNDGVLHRSAIDSAAPRDLSQIVFPANQRDAGPRFVSDLSRTPIVSASARHERQVRPRQQLIRPLQFHLIVSSPHDPLELEADRIAAEVVQSQSAVPTPMSGAVEVSRQIAEEADEDLSAASLDTEEDVSIEDELGDVDETIGDESGRPKLKASTGNLASRREIEIPDGPGHALASGTREFMERGFGFDFQRVRVHADPESAVSAASLQAHAYTVGDDIYFNEGQFRPDTQEGKLLLAHELTHVVQQSSTGERQVRRKPKNRSGKNRGGGNSNRPPAKRKRSQEPKLPCATGECKGGACAAPVEPAIRHPSCGNEACAPSGAANSSQFIRHLDVNLATQIVTAEIGSNTKTTSTRTLLSSPRPGTTPEGLHHIGTKCGACHTNMKAHGMGWFTGFYNNLEFGFHNSQRVGKGVHSAGCVRIAPCSEAKWIHDNTASGITTVCIHKGGGCKRTSSTGAGPSDGDRPNPGVALDLNDRDLHGMSSDRTGSNVLSARMEAEV